MMLRAGPGSSFSTTWPFRAEPIWLDAMNSALMRSKGPFRQSGTRLMSMLRSAVDLDMRSCIPLLSLEEGHCFKLEDFQPDADFHPIPNFYTAHISVVGWSTVTPFFM